MSCSHSKNVFEDGGMNPTCTSNGKEPFYCIQWVYASFLLHWTEHFAFSANITDVNTFSESTEWKMATKHICENKYLFSRIMSTTHAFVFTFSNWNVVQKLFLFTIEVIYEKTITKIKYWISELNLNYNTENGTKYRFRIKLPRIYSVHFVKFAIICSLKEDWLRSITCKQILQPTVKWWLSKCLFFKSVNIGKLYLL